MKVRRIRTVRLAAPALAVKALAVMVLAVMALAVMARPASAQYTPSDPYQSDMPHTPKDRTGSYVVGAILAGIAGLIIKHYVFSESTATPPSPGGSNTPPPLPPTFQVGQNSSSSSRNSLGRGAGLGGAGGAAGLVLRRGFNLPRPGETRFVANEVILDIPGNLPQATLDRIAAQFQLTLIEQRALALTGRTLHRWRINSGATVRDVIRELSASRFASARQIAGAGANYVFELAQAATQPMNADQYAPQKLNIPDAHRFATGERVLVAVIDSGVDATHPDLTGAIVENFDAVGAGDSPHAHGTSMAGSIAARRNMLGVAPRVGLLTAQAFSSKTKTGDGTTFAILKSLDWAAERGANIVNMSFAGPSDPLLRDALAKATRKGLVLIAAAGNAGPNAPPMFPAADPNVIAVTATDSNDALFKGANRGDYIAVAAPGVDILAPTPSGAYQLSTGTSIAAAEVSGVAALLLERNRALKPAAIRKILMDTATDLGPKGRDRDFGAGLVNALQALRTIVTH